MAQVSFRSSSLNVAQGWLERPGSVAPPLVTAAPLFFMVEAVSVTIGITEKNRCISKLNCWLVVWTPPKNISQLGWLFPIYGKIKMFQTTNQIVCYESVSNHCIDMIDMIYCLNQRLQGIHHLGVLGQCANEHSSLLAEPVDANWMPYKLASFWRTPLHHMAAAANG